MASRRNGLRKPKLGVDLPVDDPAHVSVTNANISSDRRLRQASGLEGDLHIIHGSKIAAELQNCQGAANHVSASIGQNLGMGHWMYRDAFDIRYQEYRDRTGESVQQIADALGVAVGTLNSYRRKGDAITPHPMTLVKAARLFGCDVMEFMPDYRAITNSGLAISALTDVDVYRISEGARMIGDPSMSQADKDEMIRALYERRDLISRVKRIAGSGK